MSPMLTSNYLSSPLSPRLSRRVNLPHSYSPVPSLKTLPFSYQNNYQYQTNYHHTQTIPRSYIYHDNPPYVDQGLTHKSISDLSHPSFVDTNMDEQSVYMSEGVPTTSAANSNVIVYPPYIDQATQMALNPRRGVV